MQSMEWFHHESQSQEVREIAEHLNRAAKSMVDDVAVHQARVVKNIGKMAKDFTQWVEPGSDCDSD
jgi:cell division septum initiation protein DivIVA